MLLLLSLLPLTGVCPLADPQGAGVVGPKVTWVRAQAIEERGGG